jgi:transcriptional regulator with XRE-family HTH domain
MAVKAIQRSSLGVPESNPPDPQLLAFGMHVRRLREARKLSLEELAARSGMSFRGLVYIEHGRRNPSLLSLLRIASGLKITPDQLLSCFSSREQSEGTHIDRASGGDDRNGE